MDRINGAGHVGHMFVAEDVDASRQPTEVTDDWLNAVQEELVAPVLASDQALSSADSGQLLKAIKIIGRRMMGAVAAAGGTADAITAVFDPPVTALVDGLTVSIRAAGANTATTPTFTPAPAVIAAKTIVKGAGATLLAGDISGAGHWIDLKYDATADKWVLLSTSASVPDATDTVKGKTKVITAAGDATGADNSTSAASTGWIKASMLAIATAAGFVINLSAYNGQIKFPSWLGGLIFKWVVGAVDPADATEVVQNLTYATAFPNASLAEFVSTRIGSASTTSDQFYQTFGASASGCSVQRQVAGSSSGNRATAPILFAIGY